jgi:hypothetical protein
VLALSEESKGAGLSLTGNTIQVAFGMMKLGTSEVSGEMM